MLNHIITNNSITVLINNKPEIVDSTHPNFDKVEDCLKSGCSEKEVLNLMNTSRAVVEFGEGKVQVKDGEITYDGKVVHSSLSIRIISLMERGFDIKPFTNFMENLYQNPSKSAVDELYGFLEACNLPITEDGCFLAYKKITEDYKDCYTNTIDNSIGTTPRMPRYEVDEDSNQTCSSGLHVASYSYMASYGGARIVICKVNPKNVVAVPNDYNNSKMRVCEYEVINEVNVTNEEIADNVISDEEAYSKDFEFEDISWEDNFNDENEPTEEDFDACYKSGSTAFLEDELEDYNEYSEQEIDKNFEETIDILEKVRFSKKLEIYLSTYNEAKWDKLREYFFTNGKEIGGLVQTCLTLKDSSTLINKIKSMAKIGDFKKKDLLKYLDI